MQSAQRLHHRLDAVMVGRDGEHAKGTDSGALLFETLDADLKRLFLDLRGRHYLDGRPDRLHVAQCRRTCFGISASAGMIFTSLSFTL